MEEKKGNRPLSDTDASAQASHIAIPSIDWLQFDFRGFLIKRPFYTWIEQTYSTRHFAKISEARLNGFPIFEVTSEPKSEILPKELNIIKLNNRECYWHNPVARLKEAGNNCNLSFHSVSRVDICIDFSTFARNYNPESFIKRFMQNKYTCKKKRQGSSNFDHGDNLTFHYLRLQAKRSNIGVYLYNKSHEMREVKKKNYIINKWKICGLDTSKDIWRLEFSIHNSKFDMINKNTKIHSPFEIDRIDDNYYLQNVIQVLIDNYFTFFQKTNSRARNCTKKVNLFNFKPTKQTIKFRDESRTTDRGDRIFLNKLQDLNNELRCIKRAEASDCKNIINYIKKTRQL
jgi:hypothetical protein